ncbi:MAG: hypothetical protein ACTSR8_03025 [Promethearchaeota archaeon]
MEKIHNIIKEIREKKGRDWLGLQQTTYEQLDLLARYLTQSKLHEDPRKVEELIKLYYNAKKSGFLKMEDINRKITQLKITLGEPNNTVILPVFKSINEREDKPLIDDYPTALNDLRKRLEVLLESREGQSLPEKTYESLTTFLHYLNHPRLLSKPQLFDEMFKKFNLAESSDFLRMQGLNDILNMVEIKLGKLTDEIKKWKSPEERKMAEELEKVFFEEDKKAVEAEKKKFDEAWREIEEAKKQLELERQEFEKEKEKLEDQKLELKHELTNLRMEKTLIENEKKRLERMKEDLDKKFKEFESKLKVI